MKFHLSTSRLLTVMILLALASCKPPLQTQTTMKDQKATAAVIRSAYVGTYTQKEGHVDGKAAGIYYVEVDTKTGHVTLKDSTAQIVNPSFVKASHDGKLLYAISETGEGEIFTYAINRDHSLTLVNKLPTGAPAPCHIAIDATDQYVIVSNYLGGIVNICERGPDGALREIQRLKLNEEGDLKETHAHSATFSPDNKFVFIMDLGKDRLWHYRFDDKTGKLTPDEVPFQSASEVGAGPRHFTFAPNGKLAFVINEHNSTISSYTYNSDQGELTPAITKSTLPAGYTGNNSCADIHVHPNGKFVYGSNRGHDTIVCFAIGEGGQLTLLGHTPTGGNFPRNFSISPGGNHLLVTNQNSDNILSFRLDTNTGELIRMSESWVMTPVCIDFVDVME